MKVYNNIDLIQLQVIEGGRIYFPSNVDFKDKKIDTISLFSDRTNHGMIQSPFDDRTLFNRNYLSSLYINLYNSEGKHIIKEAQGINFDSWGNFRYQINDILSLVQSYLYIKNYSGNILLYVAYNTEDKDIELPNKSVTVHIQSNLKRIKLSNYIDEYIRRSGYRIKGIDTYYTGNNDYYLDLREKSGKVFRYVPSSLFIGNGSLENIRKNEPFLTNDFDIDFENSYIYNPYTAGTEIEFDLTFYF